MANEAANQQLPWVDFVELVQPENGGNLDQSDLQDMSDLVENIDDDNAPVLEDIPTAASTDTIIQGRRHCVQYKREIDDINNVQPWLNIHRVGKDSLTLFKIFELFIFHKFMQDRIRTNEGMESEVDVLSYNEFLVFLGIRFLMASIIGPSQKDWFLSLPINQFDGASDKMNG